MPTFYDTNPLFSHFLKSDTKRWVRFVPALPLQAAYYYDAHLGGGVLHRFLLHLARLETARSCRVALEIGSHTPNQGGLIFDATSTLREIALDLAVRDFTEAKWPPLDDPLVRKAREIVVSCSSRYGPPPFTGANRSLH